MTSGRLRKPTATRKAEGLLAAGPCLPMNLSRRRPGGALYRYYCGNISLPLR